MNYWNGDMDDLFDELRNQLPPIFTRETASKMIGGIFSPKTLSNRDAAGKGPSNKVYIGKKVAYRKEAFIQWLERLMLVRDKKTGKKPAFYQW